MNTNTTGSYILDSSRSYSLYVCSNRAIPNVIDGLKHVQRIALWIMRDKAEKMKTVALSGLCAFRSSMFMAMSPATMRSACWQPHIVIMFPFWTDMVHLEVGSRLLKVSEPHAIHPY